MALLAESWSCVKHNRQQQSELHTQHQKNEEILAVSTVQKTSHWSAPLSNDIYTTNSCNLVALAKDVRCFDKVSGAIKNKQRIQHNLKIRMDVQWTIKVLQFWMDNKTGDTRTYENFLNEKFQVAPSQYSTQHRGQNPTIACSLRGWGYVLCSRNFCVLPDLRFGWWEMETEAWEAWTTPQNANRRRNENSTAE